MSGKLNGIVKLSQVQYEQLMKNKTITVNGIKVDYNQNTLYIVEAVKVTIEDNQEIIGNKNFTGDIKKNNVDVATINDIPPVVDALTSDSSTSTLSAKQGKVLDEKIQNMMASLNGKNASFTFDTLDTLLNHFSGVSKGEEPADKYLINTDKITYGGQEYTLKNGDIFLIVDINVPDYWYSIDDKALYKLETAKVDLAEYAKITDLTMYAKTSDLAEYAKTSDVSKDYLKKDDIADWAKQANPPSNVVLVDDVYQEIDGLKVFLDGVEAGNGVSTATSGFRDARRCVDDNNNTHQLSLYVSSEGAARLAHKNRSVNANNVDSYIAFDSAKLKYGTSGNAGTAANNEYDIITSDYDAYKYALKEFEESANEVNIPDSGVATQRGIDYSSIKGALTLNGTATNTFSVEYDIDFKSSNGCVLYAFNNSKYDEINNGYVQLRRKGGNYADYVDFKQINNYKVIRGEVEFDKIRVLVVSGYSVNNLIVKPMLVKGDAILGNFHNYNQNKHITNPQADLLKNEHESVRNLVLDNTYTNIAGYLTPDANLGYDTIKSYNTNHTLYLPVEDNQVYYIKKTIGAFHLRIATTTDIPAVNSRVYNYVKTGGEAYFYVPTGRKYLLVFYYDDNDNASVYTKEQIRDGLIISKGGDIVKKTDFNQILLNELYLKNINKANVTEYHTGTINAYSWVIKGSLKLKANITYNLSFYTTSSIGTDQLYLNESYFNENTFIGGSYLGGYGANTYAERIITPKVDIVINNDTIMKCSFAREYPLNKFMINEGSTRLEYQEWNGEIVHQKDLAKVATTGYYWDLLGTPTIPSAPTDYISYEKSQSLTSTQKNQAAKNMGIDKPWNLWWTNSNSSSLSGNAAFSALDITLSWSMTSGQAYEIKVVYLVEPAGDDSGYVSYQEQTFVFWGGSAKGRGRFSGVPQDDFGESAFRFYQRELKKGTAANVLSFTSCKRFGYASSAAVGESNWNCVPVYIYGREIDMSFKS